jgi:hypothetical protein
MSMYFKFLAAALPSMNIAQPISGLSVMFMVVFSGFVANTSFIPPWWIWLYYINPIAWALQAVAVNEFSSGGYYDTPWNEASNNPLIGGDPVNGSDLIFTFCLNQGDFSSGSNNLDCMCHLYALFLNTKIKSSSI